MIDELNEIGRKRSWSNHGTLVELERRVEKNQE
jgi:hypothetical protein